MANLINTDAQTLTNFSTFEWVDQYNPQEAIAALRSNEDFEQNQDEESWFATALVDGALVAMYGEGPIAAPHTPIQYIALS